MVWVAPEVLIEQGSMALLHEIFEDGVPFPPFLATLRSILARCGEDVYTRPSHCPNPDCKAHVGTPGRFWIKSGYYVTKHNHQPVPRYQCLHCRRKFSSTLGKPKRQQHRPDLNRRLFEMVVSGVSGRRATLLLGCHRRTFDRKIRFLALLAQSHHAEMLAGLKTGHVMMDELITFVHARPKRLSVAVVVRVSTGQILAFAVSRLCAHEFGQTKYQWTEDETSKKIPAMFQSLAPVLKAEATITTDASTSYGKWLRASLPHVKHRAVKSIVSKLASKSNEKDPLFAINLTFAKMRNDMARLARKTWTTTKSIEGLENHLWLYLAWINGYELR
jgi:hypothetical protein